MEVHKIWTRCSVIIAIEHCESGFTISQCIVECRMSFHATTTPSTSLSSKAFGNACATNGDRMLIFAQLRYISELMTPKFTKLLQDIAASSPVLMPLCRWRYCISFRNATADEKLEMCGKA